MKKVSILALHSAMAGSVMGPMDIFSQVGVSWNYIFGQDAAPFFDVKIVSMDGQPVTCFNSLVIQPHQSAHDVDTTDLIIVAAFANVERVIQSCQDAANWLKGQHAKGATIASVCLGSFLLAETGLLNGKSATTHWGYAHSFQRRYPQVRLKPEQIITDEGDLLCSGTYGSYIDLSFYLIDRYCGRTKALESSKCMLHDRDRTSQAAYAVYRPAQHQDSKIISSQKWIENNYSQPIDLDDLACKCGMGRRTFERRFKTALGMTPFLYAQRMRIEAAKAYLETTDNTFEEIAYQVGYENSSFFRKIFIKHTGLKPKEYQRKFQQVA
jgi:transcriptional regulator GlxA family with amidase domain